MPTLPSGAVVRLLAVFCVTAGCAAAQKSELEDLTTQLASLTDASCSEQSSSEPLPRDCSELSARARSGIYLLQPGMDRLQLPVAAYCDMVTNGGNWTVFQRRTNIEPHQDVYLGWAAYKEGFGELKGEFWWGLDKLWRMTSALDRQYQLRVDLESFAGEKGYALYDNFRISSKADGYRLSAGNYTGDVGDSLRYHFNSQFSTRDRDQDGYSGDSCAQLATGAWWYGDPCGGSNLNGPYLDGPSDVVRGIHWLTWKGLQSLKKTEMKIRRV